MEFLTERETPRVVIEEPTPFSRSILWRLQRAFFDSRGVRAWNEAVVPHYVTSNAWIAESYAAVVFGWLRDSAASIDRGVPVPIIELGCGNGRFGWLFLRRLQRLLETDMLRGVRVRYVYTDFTEYNLDVLRSHPSLQPLVEAGVVDFARFDVESSRELQLTCSGEVLSASTARNPAAVIANYVFDGVPSDCFRIENGRLCERLLRVEAPEGEDIEDPAVLDRLVVTHEDRPATAAYPDESWNAILETYRTHENATIVFPCAALTSLRHLHELSGGRLLLLSGDKGFADGQAVAGMKDVSFVHHGSFSIPVNYDAIGQWTVARGGAFLRPSFRALSLTIVACLFDRGSAEFPETRLAFEQHIERRGPDDFFALKKGVEQQYQSFTFPQLAALLRFSGWDHVILLDAFGVLLQHAGEGSDETREEVRGIARAVWAEYFPLRETDDLAFHLGLLMMATGAGAEALELFHRSLELHGPDAATFTNMALCHGLLEQWISARARAADALELEPGYEAAQTLIDQLPSGE